MKRYRPYPHFGLALILTAIISGAPLCGSLYADDNACLDRTIAVNVLSPDVHFVPGLTPQDFSANVHGKPATIVSLAQNSDHRRFVIVLTRVEA